MRSIALLVSLAFALPAWAQQKEPAKPAVQAAATPQAAPKASRKPNPKRSEDARHCLEKPTNTEIIKCSEEYL